MYGSLLLPVLPTPLPKASNTTVPVTVCELLVTVLSFPCPSYSGYSLSFRQRPLPQVYVAVVVPLTASSQTLPSTPERKSVVVPPDVRLKRRPSASYV